jgi:hypothetical protein
MPDIGHGSIIQFSTDDGTTFTKITRVKSFTFPAKAFDDVETTHFESPGREREFMAGLIDNGEVTITHSHTPDDGSGTNLDAQLNDALGSNVQISITVNGGQERTFNAFLKGYQPNIPLDDEMVAEITFRMGGEITA